MEINLIEKTKKSSNIGMILKMEWGLGMDFMLEPRNGMPSVHH